MPRAQVLVPDDVELSKTGFSFQRFSHPYKRAFLTAYAERGTARAAAKAAGITYRCHKYWVDGDPEYAAAFEEAKALFADRLEDHLFDLSDQATPQYAVPLIVALKGARPEKYKDNPTTIIDNSQHVHLHADQALPALREALRKARQEVQGGQDATE